MLKNTIEKRQAYHDRKLKQLDKETNAHKYTRRLARIMKYSLLLSELEAEEVKQTLKGDEEMEKVKNTVEQLVTGTSRQTFSLSAEIIKLEVIQGAVASLMDEVEDIKHKKWDEDPTMARLSINEIRDKVRLIDMAFYPLFLTFRDDVNKLEEHASELFDIIIKQSNSDEG